MKLSGVTASMIGWGGDFERRGRETGGHSCMMYIANRVCTDLVNSAAIVRGAVTVTHESGNEAMVIHAGNPLSVPAIDCDSEKKI